MRSAAARFGIYGAAFVAVAAFAPLAFTASYLRPAGLDAAGASAASAFESHMPQTLCSALAAVALILLSRLIADLLSLLRIKVSARIVAGAPPQTRRAPVACSARVSTPTAIGYFHPRIVVPLELVERVSDAEWRAIVAHENAHLERFDDWTKAVQSALVRIFWFSPALWFLADRLDLERESASDERAAAAVDPRTYAACLLRLAADVRPSLAPAAWTTRSQVAIRVERLLRPAPRTSRMASAARGLVLAVSMSAAAIGAVVLVPASRPVPAPARVAVHAFVPTAIVAPIVERRSPASLAVIGWTTARRRGAIEHAVVRPLAEARRADPNRMEVAAVPETLPCRNCALLRRPVQDGPISPTFGARANSDSAPVTTRPAPSFLPSVDGQDEAEDPSSGTFDLLPIGR